MEEHDNEELSFDFKKYEQLKKELRNTFEKRQIDFFKPYGWQKEFFDATKTHKQISIIAANRVGKTRSACALLSYCLTGEYPEDYDGKKFSGPILAVAAGVTGDQIRDVLQNELIGEVDLKDQTFQGGGLIPTEALGRYIVSTGTRNLLKEVKVKHRDGGWSTLRFRSYEQGASVIRGQSLDFILIDEEPLMAPMEFYGECLARTATGDKMKGGLVVLSFTPEKGVTELVDMLLNGGQKGQWTKTVGWDMAPHLSEEVKKQLLAAIPRHMRDAKTKGIPTFGDSQVFRVREEDIMIKRREIPAYFRLLCGIDFGYGHPFAAVFMAHDPDTDILYVYDTIKRKEEVPTTHAHLINSKCKNIRVVYPHDGMRREKTGNTAVQLYKDAGLNMFRQFTNPDGSISVEPGLLEMEQRMVDGRIKIFDDLHDFWDEFRKYHRNPKTGMIVKENDDIMDAFRYCSMMIPRFGEKKALLGQEIDFDLFPVMDI